MQRMKAREGVKDCIQAKARALGGLPLKTTMRESDADAHVPTLPSVGMSRWEQLRHFIPLSRESWRKLVNARRAPMAHKLSARCTMYANVDVHRWLANPAEFRLEE